MEPTSALFIWIIVGMFGYFLPALIAAGRKHHQAGAIFALDLLLGWTFLGWVGALVWALTAVKPRDNQEPPHPSN